MRRTRPIALLVPCTCLPSALGPVVLLLLRRLSCHLLLLLSSPPLMNRTVKLDPVHLPRSITSTHHFNVLRVAYRSVSLVIIALLVLSPVAITALPLLWPSWTALLSLVLSAYHAWSPPHVTSTSLHVTSTSSTSSDAVIFCHSLWRGPDLLFH